MTKTNNRNTGLVLIGLGTLFIALRIAGFTMMSLLWPLWVLIPGMLMLFMGFKDNTAQPGWAIPGSIVGGTGTILFLLNLTGRWEAWSYMWAMYPVFVGLALYYVGRQNSNDTLIQSGKQSATSGLWMLVGFGLFFELMIFGGFDLIFGSAIVPLLLIAAGAYMVLGGDHVHLFDFSTNEKPKRKLSDIDPVTGINPELRHEMDRALADNDSSV